VIKKSMTVFPCAAILFDLDGVLIDSTGSVGTQWRAWAREHGIVAEKVLAIAHGVRTVEVIRTIAPHLDAEEEARRLERRAARDQAHVAIMPGAVEFVKTIPPDRWGVVTSGGRVVASARLRLGGFSTPKALVTAEDVVNGKPHPEPYLKGAKLLRARPEECLVIEDAPAGIRSAHNGGMKVVGFASTYKREELQEADAVVSAFRQLSVVAENGWLRVSTNESIA
jgi:mannitol-1-/sugar-/sorbitol-6-phosphatase